MYRLYRSAFLITTLLVSTSLLAEPQLSAPTRIESVAVLDGLGVMRINVLVSNPPSNPAGCLNDNLIDIRLDSPDRTETQQRELMNLINLAFITRRQVRFWLLSADDPDPCSTEATSSSIRVAVGVQTIY